MYTLLAAKNMLLISINTLWFIALFEQIHEKSRLAEYVYTYTNKELDGFFSLGGHMVDTEKPFLVFLSNQIHFFCSVTINPVLFMRSHHKFTFQSHKKKNYHRQSSVSLQIKLAQDQLQITSEYIGQTDMAHYNTHNSNTNSTLWLTKFQFTTHSFAHSLNCSVEQAWARTRFNHFPLRCYYFALQFLDRTMYTSKLTKDWLESIWSQSKGTIKYERTGLRTPQLNSTEDDWSTIVNRNGIN